MTVDVLFGRPSVAKFFARTASRASVDVGRAGGALSISRPRGGPLAVDDGADASSSSFLFAFVGVLTAVVSASFCGARRSSPGARSGCCRTRVGSYTRRGLL